MSEFSKPLPPDTTIFALPSSGLSLFETSLLIKIVFRSVSTKEISSIDASPPESSDFSKEVGLIVNRLIFWLVCTWEIAFPA